MSKAKYFPILKWKSGEKQALTKLSDDIKDGIAPIIEIVEPDDFSNIISFTKELHGINRIYYDCSYIEEGSEGYLENLIFQAAREELSIFPVLSYDEFKYRSNNFIEISSEILVKVPIPVDFEGDSYEKIFSLLDTWKSKHGLKVSILLDLGLVEDRSSANRQFAELKRVLGDYIRNSSFQNIIIGITSFPDDLSNIPSGGEAFYTRYDIKIFEMLVSSKDYNDLRDFISYSDYGVTKFTDSEIDFSRLRYGILPKARYTTDDSYWISKGQRNNETKEWIKNHQSLAQSIYNSQYYFGEDFSFGDYDIMERALGHVKDNPEKKVGPGGNTNWVTNAVSHHITVVVNELSRIFDFSKLT
ncbi:beta family protein [Ornithinibacillus halotolerans]|uniref:Beta protein n=1 Tax=Ornithinibacillus halotolerans TaxID=1274357 RepID=A0A916WE28_9BACI|nr:hypothetical protein [Ornithinibacillus halotolerans]GGA91002.1 hypothetical protein GCM10008025_36900 [Ornithinibacillus halotolerans]